MKKKILSLILVLMLISTLFILTGCGDTEENKETNETSTENITQNNENDSENEISKVDSKWYWSEDEDGEKIITDGEVELHIGDIVNYDEQTQVRNGAISSYISKKENTGLANLTTYSLDQEVTLESNDVNWAVLGLDEETGEILLVSKEIVYTDTELHVNWDKNYYLLFYKEGYANGVSELNNICELFGYGNGASGARSITIEDINNLTGYDPETDEFGEGETYEYGMEITYTMTTDGVECVDENGNVELNDDYDTEENPFIYYDGDSWQTLDLNESITLTNTAFAYVSTDYPNELIFLNYDADSLSDENSSLSYWVASDFYTYVNWSEAYGHFKVVIKYADDEETVKSYVSMDYVAGNLGPYLLSWDESGIRPVVSLSSDIELDGNSLDGWNIE